MAKRQSNSGKVTTQKHQPSQKAMKALFAKLRAQGLVIVPKNGHWHIKSADGQLLTVTSGSPTDADLECQYIRRRLRRYHGIEVE